MAKISSILVLQLNIYYGICIFILFCMFDLNCMNLDWKCEKRHEDLMIQEYKRGGNEWGAKCGQNVHKWKSPKLSNSWRNSNCSQPWHCSYTAVILFMTTVDFSFWEKLVTTVTVEVSRRDIIHGGTIHFTVHELMFFFNVHGYCSLMNFVPAVTLKTSWPWNPGDPN